MCINGFSSGCSFSSSHGRGGDSVVVSGDGGSSAGARNSSGGDQ